eukprot:572572-Pyramimonas_sp.AAC.1
MDERDRETANSGTQVQLLEDAKSAQPLPSQSWIPNLSSIAWATDMRDGIHPKDGGLLFWQGSPGGGVASRGGRVTRAPPLPFPHKTQMV